MTTAIGKKTTKLEPFKMERGVKYRDAAKTSVIQVRNIDPDQELLKKPEWMKIKLPTNSAKIDSIKYGMRRHGLHSVCEEASCPNLHECFNHGTATFMIMGAICTRRCPFCDVAHGKPLPLDPYEPRKVAETVQDMKLKYVVITSVDRDDLADRGAAHFAATVREIKALNPECKVEILVPDFRGRVEQAVAILKQNPPDVFNHNLENVPRLYREIRPGADYKWSLELLKIFKQEFPNIPTKSGLMVGLGETNEEILAVMQDLRDHGVTMLTVGQYLQPSRHHLRVERYVPPAEFEMFRSEAEKMGFEHAACGPFVRSSYHADLQAKGELVK
ncbi:lipoyl synthase [[Haemophilus] ducreyi]|uniref:Lipoyl synthase n=2 Tax=Haemophilus ducreyi TaxID=730 RepID=LIPA_HAEDU|nr:lipoyl synthase [[Haemophilus] ducreyi]Q7VKB1.1 RecName: Full=Lipoyl synthase; AltName: Full=Lip-syn; Short=LS; AltName: Full=Lipoate synthase; AltName: Full=Lipoic acid synthase; AltName: Full=Sulfur insertion protein LipA [[Haemophilus] ducreyi 35000HP]AAP96721.1 lipoic acid synthetase [[Haemophilus] ducreyi 35000HP]AKO31545.1 lipoyl synthase [[Haemophilus] ducreyi]AKO33002.1 lipoyl synthase [[Haemophilus] ducreyi]AKO34448.1 lipoyl synthase [[Haemophilus] ducreyi]AKO35893.1 lipoyl syntha